MQGSIWLQMAVWFLYKECSTIYTCCQCSCKPCTTYLLEPPVIPNFSEVCIPQFKTIFFHHWVLLYTLVLPCPTLTVTWQWSRPISITCSVACIDSSAREGEKNNKRKGWSSRGWGYVDTRQTEREGVQLWKSWHRCKYLFPPSLTVI